MNGKLNLGGKKKQGQLFHLASGVLRVPKPCERRKEGGCSKVLGTGMAKGYLFGMFRAGVRCLLDSG